MNSNCVPNSRTASWMAGEVLLTLLFFSTAGCDLPGKPKQDDQYVAPQKEMRFSVLFQENCTACHGSNGKLGPAPPLNDGLFLALVTDKELHRVISEGRAGTLMPAFAASQGGHLTNDQVKVLVKGITEKWRSTEPAPSGAPPYLALSPTPPSSKVGKEKEKFTGQSLPFAPSPQGGGGKGVGAAPGILEKGLQVFKRACASCHGEHGEGGRYGGKADGRPVGAINDPNFLALISDQALRRYVITGRPDLGMPDYAGTTGRPKSFQALTAENVTDIVALLASWRTESLNGKGN
jgi:cytochrome c oxidase cbb3-type subunit 3/ubiquinol-cytochrome c reductase cytochrome c subunit